MAKRDDKKNRNRQRDFSSIGDVLDKFQIDDEDKYVTKEFQQYGYDLAQELGDLKNKSLYIKLAKEENRGFMETARHFVKDANNVKSPAKLFMWKLSQLKKGKQQEKKDVGKNGKKLRE